MYLVPKLLRGPEETTIANLIKVDIYAFGLVTWEAARRTFPPDNPDLIEPYERPYFHEVGNHPSEEEMIQLVCFEKSRPRKSWYWSDRQVLHQIYAIMTHCWKENKHDRLATSRVVEELVKIKP